MGKRKKLSKIKSKAEYIVADELPTTDASEEKEEQKLRISGDVLTVDCHCTKPPTRVKIDLDERIGECPNCGASFILDSDGVRQVEEGVRDVVDFLERPEFDFAKDFFSGTDN